MGYGADHALAGHRRGTPPHGIPVHDLYEAADGIGDQRQSQHRSPLGRTKEEGRKKCRQKAAGHGQLRQSL